MLLTLSLLNTLDARFGFDCETSCPQEPTAPLGVASLVLFAFFSSSAGSIGWTHLPLIAVIEPGSKPHVCVFVRYTGTT